MTYIITVVFKNKGKLLLFDGVKIYMASDTQGRYLLAVYGTLKENFPNYFYYLNPLKPIFSGLVKIPFQMYTNGGFPLLFPSEKLHSIYIEIFEIDEKILNKIDLLEGVPHHYTRQLIFLNELKAEVFIYVITNREPYGELIENGFF